MTLSVIIVKINKKISVASDRSPRSKTDELRFRNILTVHLGLLGERATSYTTLIQKVESQLLNLLSQDIASGDGHQVTQSQARKMLMTLELVGENSPGQPNVWKLI